MSSNRDKLKLIEEMARRKKQEEYSEDFERFATDHIRILPKDATQGFIPFAFNEAQAHINEQLEKQLKETGKVRAIVLKARQQGISTFSAARVFWKTYYAAFTKSVIMAHDSATSDALFTMSRNIIENMNDDMRPAFKKSNAKELQFSHNNAGYRLYTAGSPEAGRGTTPTILHASEVAFWLHAEKILSGLFNGLSQAAGTEVIIESTANGAEGEFFRLWQGAVAGENEYIPIFVPWFLTSEYRRPSPEGFERTVEEDDLLDKYGLDDDQLYWRRLKVGEGGKRKFQQEYPATAEEAFLVSGASVFDQEKVLQYEAKPVKALMTFDDSIGYFEKSREGDLEVWAPPIIGQKYVIGADVALGTGQDYSCATVWTPKGELVAMYRNNRVDPSTYGDVLFYLGRYYNNALLAVESNTIGNETLNRLNQINYLNLYYETKVANLRTEDTAKLGFRMTGSSKPRVIGHLKRRVEEFDIAIPSATVISELRTYVSDPTGKTNALNGCHDDSIMSMAIAMEAIRTHGHRLTDDTVPFSQKANANFQNVNHNWM